MDLPLRKGKRSLHFVDDCVVGLSHNRSHRVPLTSGVYQAAKLVRRRPQIVASTACCAKTPIPHNQPHRFFMDEYRCIK